MYHNSAKIIILYIRCTLQLQPYPLTMASKQSANTSTSTAAKQDLRSPKPSTAHGKKKSGVAVTSSTLNPVPTSAVQQYLADAAELILTSPDTRRMFLTEVTKKCLELAKKERESTQHSPEYKRKLATAINYHSM